MERYVRRYHIKGTENEFLEIDAYYFKGDVFYNGRGYWMSWQPLKETRREGLVSVEFEPYRGTKYFVMPLKRNSKKAYENAKSMLADSADRLIQLSGYEVDDTFTEEEY